MNHSVLDAIPETDGNNYHEDVPTMHEEFEGNQVDNLSVWSQCCHTPTEFLKSFTRSGGFKGTDINPQWRLQKMTEMFGAVGTGWGWKVHDRWSEDFPGGVRCVFVVCSVWFLQHSKPSWTGEQIGGTEAGRTPDEAYKMAVTDAIGKCMAAIGVGADVYLGQCDTKYQRPEAVGGRPEVSQQQYVQQPPTTQPVYQQYTAPQPNAYSEPIQQPAQQPQQQYAPQTVPGDWRFLEIQFGKNKGKTLGSLSPNSLSWYQTDWMASRAGKNLSQQDAALYNALLSSMGKLSINSPKEAVPF